MKQQAEATVCVQNHTADTPDFWTGPKKLNSKLEMLRNKRMNVQSISLTGTANAAHSGCFPGGHGADRENVTPSLGWENVNIPLSKPKLWSASPEYK